MSAPLRIDGNGRLELPAAVAGALKGRDLALLSHSGRHLFAAVPEAGGEIVLAGSLGEVGVADLLSFFNMFRKTGILRVETAQGEKSLYFAQGEVVAALSTCPEDDLGEMFFNLGKLDRDTLNKARQRAGRDGSLGKVLVAAGVLAPKDLWLASREQAESIVYSLFALAEGSFSFLAKPLDDEAIVRFSMGTQSLIMEGLRRCDESALFRRRIPSLELLPVWVEEKALTLGPAEERFAGLIRARAGSVREVIRRSGLGEFDGLRQLYHLLEKGAVRLEEPPVSAPTGPGGEILGIYNAALTAIFRRVREKHPGFAKEIALFLRDLPQPYSYAFRDVALGADGAVDGGKVMANLAGLEEAEKRNLLAEALNELIFAECAVARRVLGAEEAAPLIKRVQEIGQRIKNLIGRTP